MSGPSILMRSGNRSRTGANLADTSRIWADELADTGVSVNVLLPGGAVDTAADVTGTPRAVVDSPDEAAVPGAL